MLTLNLGTSTLHLSANVNGFIISKKKKKSKSRENTFYPIFFFTLLKWLKNTTVRGFGCKYSALSLIIKFLSKYLVTSNSFEAILLLL